jgi:hypothetical protein
VNVALRVLHAVSEGRTPAQEALREAHPFQSWAFFPLAERLSVLYRGWTGPETGDSEKEQTTTMRGKRRQNKGTAHKINRGPRKRLKLTMKRHSQNQEQETGAEERNRHGTAHTPSSLLAPRTCISTLNISTPRQSDYRSASKQETPAPNIWEASNEKVI